MRVLLDENLDWRREEERELLLAAASEFDVFVTLDANLEHQQNVASLDLAVVVIRAASADLADVERALPALNVLLSSVQAGRSYVVVP